MRGLQNRGIQTSSTRPIDILVWGVVIVKTKGLCLPRIRVGHILGVHFHWIYAKPNLKKYVRRRRIQFPRTGGFHGKGWFFFFLLSSLSFNYTKLESITVCTILNRFNPVSVVFARAWAAKQEGLSRRSFFTRVRSGIKRR